MVDLNIDKSKWQLISFGDVAIQKKGRVDRECTTLTRYVKGEHMGSEDIHLREWGELDDEYLGPAFHRRFDEGDILYGSRRTYLKKVCIAPFSGITSNTTFVVEANEEFLDKRLLPFIMLSEGFTKHSIQHSKGSVNPYINWKDLAKYEFLLPPKDQQAEIAELLWAMDEAIQSQISLSNELMRSMETIRNQFMISGRSESPVLVKTKIGLADKHLPMVQLRELLCEKPSYGANAPSRTMRSGDVRYIRITDIDDYGNLSASDAVSIDADDFSNYILEEGDILIARTGNTVGKSYLHEELPGSFVFAGYLIRFRLNRDLLLPKFLYYFTKSVKFDRFKRRTIKVGAQPNINSEEYQDMWMPKFSISDQLFLLEKLKPLEMASDDVEASILSAASVRLAILQEIFADV